MVLVRLDLYIKKESQLSMSEEAFASGTVNHLLLTKVERDNKMKIETKGCCNWET